MSTATSPDYIERVKREFGVGNNISYINTMKPDDLQQMVNFLGYCHRQYNSYQEIIKLHISRNYHGCFEAVVSYGEKQEIPVNYLFSTVPDEPSLVIGTSALEHLVMPEEGSGGIAVYRMKSEPSAL